MNDSMIEDSDLRQWAFWKDSLDRMTKRVFNNEKMPLFLSDSKVQALLFEWHMAEIGSSEPLPKLLELLNDASVLNVYAFF